MRRSFFQQMNYRPCNALNLKIECRNEIRITRVLCPQPNLTSFTNECFERGFIVNQCSYNVSAFRGSFLLQYHNVPIEYLATNHGITRRFESESVRTILN